MTYNFPDCANVFLSFISAMLLWYAVGYEEAIIYIRVQSVGPVAQ